MNRQRSLAMRKKRTSAAAAMQVGALLSNFNDSVEGVMQSLTD